MSRTLKYLSVRKMSSFFFSLEHRALRAEARAFRALSRADSKAFKVNLGLRRSLRAKVIVAGLAFLFCVLVMKGLAPSEAKVNNNNNNRTKLPDREEFKGSEDTRKGQESVATTSMAEIDYKVLKKQYSNGKVSSLCA